MSGEHDVCPGCGAEAWCCSCKAKMTSQEAWANLRKVIKSIGPNEAKVNWEGHALLFADLRVSEALTDTLGLLETLADRFRQSMSAGHVTVGWEVEGKRQYTRWALGSQGFYTWIGCTRAEAAALLRAARRR